MESKVMLVSCSLICSFSSVIFSEPSMMLCRYFCTSSSILAQNSGASSFSFRSCSAVRSNSPVMRLVPMVRCALPTFIPSALAIFSQSSAVMSSAILRPMA